MAEEAGPTTPEDIAHLLSTFSRIYDRLPNEVAVIRDVTIEKLESGPGVSVTDPFEHVAEHLRTLLPAVIGDPRVEPVQARLVSEYAKMPSTPETRLRESPADHSVGAVVIGAAVVVGVVAAAVIVYCLGGPAPAPGTSVAARCTDRPQ